MCGPYSSAEKLPGQLSPFLGSVDETEEMWGRENLALLIAEQQGVYGLNSREAIYSASKRAKGGG